MVKYERNPDAIATLSDEEFWVTQKSGTERPGTGKLLHNKKPGIYVDIVSVNLYLLLLINLKVVVVGQVLQSPLKQTIL